MRCRIYCKNTVLEAHAHGDTRRAIDNDDGFGWNAESIVKNTVLEGHAPEHTLRRSDRQRAAAAPAESIVKNTV